MEFSRDYSPKLTMHTIMKNVRNGRVGFFDVLSQTIRRKVEKTTARKNFLSSHNHTISLIVFRCNSDAKNTSNWEDVGATSKKSPLPNCCLRVCLVGDCSEASVSRDGVLSFTSDAVQVCTVNLCFPNRAERLV